MGIKNDLAAGSRAYNRFVIQISQSLLYAIELFEELDEYLITLDYYDDITIFNDNTINDATSVSYYQMKTDEKVTITKIIKKDWLLKLYNHVISPFVENKRINQLGLILTSSISDNKASSSSKLNRFDKLPPKVKKKFIDDLAFKNNLEPDDINLSDFYIIKTELSVDAHQRIVGSKLTDFMVEKNPDITVRACNSLFEAIMTHLSKLQSYELDKLSKIEDIESFKSFTKNDFENFCKIGYLYLNPKYSEIQEYVGDKSPIYYLKIVEDADKGSIQYLILRKKITEILQTISFDGRNIGEIENSVFSSVSNSINESLKLFCNEDYIRTLIICILVQKSKMK